MAQKLVRQMGRAACGCTCIKLFWIEIGVLDLNNYDMVSLDKVPESVLACFLGYVEHEDLLNVRLACKVLRNAVLSIDGCYYQFVIMGKGKTKEASYRVSPEHEDSRSKDVSFKHIEYLHESGLGLVLAKTRTIVVNMGTDTWHEAEVCLMELLRYLEKGETCSLAVVELESAIYPLHRALLAMLDNSPLRFECSVILKVTKMFRYIYSDQFQFCGNINQLTLSVQKDSAMEDFAPFDFAEQTHWKSLVFKAGGSKVDKSLKLEKLSAVLDRCPRIDYLELYGLTFAEVEGFCQFPRHACILKIDNCRSPFPSNRITFYGETLVLNSAASILPQINFEQPVHLKLITLCKPKAFVSVLSEKKVKSLSLELPSIHSKSEYCFPEDRTSDTVEELHITVTGRGSLNLNSLRGWIQCLPELRTLHVLPTGKRLWPAREDQNNIIAICPSHINVIFH